jgi:hypothetical protein
MREMGLVPRQGRGLTGTTPPSRLSTLPTNPIIITLLIPSRLLRLLRHRLPAHLVRRVRRQCQGVGQVSNHEEKK